MAKYDKMKKALDERFMENGTFDLEYFLDMCELEPFNDAETYHFMKKHVEHPIAVHRAIMYVVRYSEDVPAGITWRDVERYLKGKRVLRDVLSHVREYIRESFSE